MERYKKKRREKKDTLLLIEEVPLTVNKVEKIVKGSLDSIPSPSSSNYGRESLFEV